MLRKYYAGPQGGALPPTDPRIMAMTDEQIDLEFELIIMDKEKKDGGNEEYFEDDGFEDYDKETDETDSRLSDNPVPSSEELESKPENTSEYDEDEWEAVEIDD